MGKKDKTLKDILDLILYENPSTQDEIAERLGISRRYVTQLLQPLVKDGTVKRAYMIDLKSYEEVVESVGDYANARTNTGNALINEMLDNMAEHVHAQLEMSFDAVLEYRNDKQEVFRTLCSRVKDAFPDYDEYNGTAYIFRTGLGRKTKFVPGLTDYLGTYPYD